MTVKYYRTSRTWISTRVIAYGWNGVQFLEEKTRGDGISDDFWMITEGISQKNSVYGEGYRWHTVRGQANENIRTPSNWFVV